MPVREALMILEYQGLIIRLPNNRVKAADLTEVTLRTSNDYDVNKDGLTLKNEAEYASFVESKGYDVLSSAALFAEKRLKEEFEK